MMGDRRASVARYIQFHDQEGMQRPFIHLAEEAYGRVSRADTWTAEATLQPAGETTVARRGLFRRAREVVVPAPSVPVTPGLAEAHRIATAAPAAMAELDGCSAGRQLAALIGEVLNELVGDLAAIPVPAQRSHAAYRQTLRLTSELTALVQVTEQLGCGDPLGCVALRKPEAWGRRDEDVEVAEVRAVLAQLAEAAARERSD